MKSWCRVKVLVKCIKKFFFFLEASKEIAKIETLGDCNLNKGETTLIRKSNSIHQLNLTFHHGQNKQVTLNNLYAHFQL